MSNSIKEEKIVILGCGLSGMLTALALAKNQIATVIIDAKTLTISSLTNDSRNIALTSFSKEFLENINIWPLLDNLVAEIKDIYVADNRSSEILGFSNKLLVGEAIGYLITYSQFKNILLNEVRKNPHIRLMENYNYENIESFSDYSLINAHENSIRCELLLVCEGNSSLTKQQFFTNKLEKDYDQTALIFSVSHDKDHEGTAVEHFTSLGAFAILPLKATCESSIVWIIDNKTIPALLSLPIDEFEYLVQQNFSNFLGKIKLNSEIEKFPLKASIAKEYFYNHIVLVGDAAHTIHPLAGQGLNLGIKDIQLITSLISSEPVTRNLLQTYQQLRQTDNEAMFLITDGLNSIFSYYFQPLFYLRKKTLQILDNLPSLKKRIMRYARGFR